MRALTLVYTFSEMSVSMRTCIESCLPKDDRVTELLQSWFSLLLFVYKITLASIAEQTKICCTHDGYHFMTFLDSCDLKQPTLLQDHILDLIPSSTDRDTIVDVKICDFISDYALIKCSIAFPHPVAHTPIKVQF